MPPPQEHTLASIDTSPGKSKFGENPAAYHAARPGYPPVLFEWLTAKCALGSGADCFEIGPGTGHATLPLLKASVRSLLAVEPDRALAAYLAIAANDPRLTIIEQPFESAMLEPAGFNFGFAATSFHWLPRMKSFARVLNALKPGGRFAMWWNVYHDPANPDAFARAIQHLFVGIEQNPEATASRPAFGLDAKSRMSEMRLAGFTTVEHGLFGASTDFTPDQIAALYGTFSRVRMARPERRDRLLEEARRIAWEDFGGVVSREITTSVYVGCKPAL